MSWVAIISTIAIGAGPATAGPSSSVDQAPITGLTEFACRQIQHEMTGRSRVDSTKVLIKVRCFNNDPNAGPVRGPEVLVSPQDPYRRDIADDGTIHDDLVPMGPEFRNGRPTGGTQYEIVPHMPTPVDRLGRY